MSWLSTEETRRYATSMPSSLPASVSSAASTKTAALMLKKAAVVASATSEEASHRQDGCFGGHVSPSTTDYLPMSFPPAFSSSSSSSTCTSNAHATNLPLPSPLPLPPHKRTSHLASPLLTTPPPPPPHFLPLGPRSPPAIFEEGFSTHPVRTRAATLSPEEEDGATTPTTVPIEPSPSSHALTLLRELTQEMQQSLTESTLRRSRTSNGVRRGSIPTPTSSSSVFSTSTTPRLDHFEHHAATMQPRCPRGEIRHSPDGREATQSWRSSGSEEREIYLSQWLPPPLPPQHRPTTTPSPHTLPSPHSVTPTQPPPQLGKSALSASARRQQLRRRRQRNMTTGGMTKVASEDCKLQGNEPAGMRNSVSFNGINGEPRQQPTEVFGGDGNTEPLRSDSLVDVLHRRYYSHQYMAARGTQPLIQVASLEHANALLNSPLGAHSHAVGIAGSGGVYDLRGADHKCAPFPKSKSMNDASWHQGISAAVVEACRWLIEAGFPQYAQMMEDGAFPLDLETVREDHRFMDEDALSALFRRIDTLNECVIAQRKDHAELPGPEEVLINKMGRAAAFDSSDGDASEEYALSRRWQFERDTRRWSRIDHDAVVQLAEPEPEPDFTHLQDEPSAAAPPPGPDEARRSRTAKRGSRADSPSGLSRSLLRSASLRLRSAVSRFRRGDLNFRSLRRSKKASSASAASTPGVTTSSSAPTDTLSGHSNSTSSAGVSPSAAMLSHPSGPMPASRSVVMPTPPSLPAPAPVTLTHHPLPTSSSAHRLAPTLTGLDRRHSAAPAPTGANGNGLAPSAGMQILVNDTIDTGSGDKINIRTGSFMGKAGHRHEGFLRRRPDQPGPPNINNNNNNDICLHHESAPPKLVTEDSALSGNGTAEGETLRPAEELDRILQALYSDIDMLDEMMDAAGKGSRMTTSSVSAPTSPRLLDVPSSGESGSPAEVLAQFSDIEGYDLDSQIVELKRLERLRRAGDCRRPSLERAASSSVEHSSEQENSFDSGSNTFRSTTSTLRRNAPSRWSSVERNYRQSVYQQDQSMSGMSVKQLILLRKIALLKLTTIMEKYCPPHKSLFSWAIPKLLRRGRSHSETDPQGKLFGVNLAGIFQRTGCLLPRAILNAFAYLKDEGTEALGIFRRAGGKSRTLALREKMENDKGWNDFSSWQPYDVADVVKLYFRELPECLLTNKLSSTLINIFIYLPLELRLEALQWAILRLPDENRMVLQCLLHFLRHMADHSEVTQMPASNLAVCLAPSLFNFPHALPSGLSPKRLRRVTGSPDPKDLADQKAAHECLTVMIQFSGQLFLISENILNQCQFDADELGEAPELSVLAPPRPDSLGRDWQTLAGERLGTLLRDCRDRGKGWVHANAHAGTVEIFYKKVNDGHPLKLWRCSLEVEAPPDVLLHRLWSERAKWDPSVESQEVLEHLSEDADVVHLAVASLAPPHPSRECVLLRIRQSALEGGACALLSSSISHADGTLGHSVLHPLFIMQDDVLIDPCGSGKCRVHWVSRVDMRGFTAEWYSSSWSHCVARVLLLLQQSFVKSIESRETRL